MVWFAPKHAHSTLVEAQEWERKKKKTKKTKCSTESVEGICYAVLHLRIYVSYMKLCSESNSQFSSSKVQEYYVKRLREKEREPMANAYGKRAHINQSTEPSNNHKCERAIRCLFNMNLLVSVSAFFGCCCYFFWLFFSLQCCRFMKEYTWYMPWSARYHTIASKLKSNPRTRQMYGMQHMRMYKQKRT